MKINKEKVINYWNKLIKNKAFLYFNFCIVLLLFCFTLNITFAKYTHTKTIGANITIGQLKYNMQINNGELEDRILRINKNDTRIYNIVLTSLNKYETKYELIYHVCSDEKCSSYIDMPNDLSVKVSSKSPSKIEGSLKSNDFVTMTIAGINGNPENDYYIKLDLNAGFYHNDLALTNQINETYYDDDITIVSFVDGLETDDFPTDGNYSYTYECKVGNTKDENVTVTGKWAGTKWNFTVDNVSKSKTVCNILFEKIEGTLLASAIRTNYPNIESPKTTPGSKTSDSSEAILASTKDDYGTSYYFRGNIRKNYVQFANKCWRIVRITGNGAIKLILHNDNTAGATNPCSYGNNNSSAAYAKYSGTTYTNRFSNVSQGYNAYIGFMYGAPSRTYAAEHANTNKSTVLQNLETWYEKYFKDREYESKLADTIWCNDKSVVTDTSYEPWSVTYGIGTNYGIGSNNNFYSAAKRLVKDWQSPSGSPTLICPSISLDGVNKNISKFTVDDEINGNGNLKYKIGLLTADEAAFAGLAFNYYNQDNYLVENASETSWWTMSPFGNINDSTYVFSINDGGKPEYTTINYEYALRPVISLNANVIISDGTGTSSDPFVID